MTCVLGFNADLNYDLQLRDIRLDPQICAATAVYFISQYFDSDNNRGPSKDDCLHWLDSMSACGTFVSKEIRTNSNYVGSPRVGLNSEKLLLCF